jgi:hypothetical protein
MVRKQALKSVTVCVKSLVVICECRELNGTHFNGVTCVELKVCVDMKNGAVWLSSSSNGGAAGHKAR